MNLENANASARGASGEKLSLLLRKLRQEKTKAAAPQPEPRAERTIPKADRSRPLPASFGQEQLWLLDRLEPGSAVYNMPIATLLEGELDPRTLELCLQEVVRRHESLRTTFAVRDGSPVQVVAPPGGFRLPRVDLSELSPEARRERVDELISAESAAPFDLGRGPLHRALLVRLGETEHVLIQNLHHAVSDGWSIGLLLDEIAALYDAACRGRSLGDALPPLAVQYGDFAVWQRRQLEGEHLARQLDYWRRQLDGAAPALELPTDWQRAAVPGHRGGVVSHRLDAGLSARLRSLARDSQASLYMTLLAAFKLLLHRLTGQDDVLVGTPNAGRGRFELERLIGFFLNTLVLRTRLSGELTFRQLLGRVRETVLGAFSHQDVPFEKLLTELKPERHLSRTPFFQVLFNMVNLPVRRSGSGGLELSELPLPRVESKFDFTFYVKDVGDGIDVDMVYNVDLFRHERMTEMVGQYATLLTQVAEDPDRRLDRFDLVTPAAAEVLPRPDATLSDAWHGAIHRAFAENARRFPERPAVEDPDGVTSYGELEGASNRLAHELMARGVRRGDVVVVYAHRSAALVWALLGVLKAGGAFVVLDPAYPAARLADTVRLARPRALLELDAAGEPPAEMLEALGDTFRLRLPALAGAAGFLAERPDGEPEVEVGPDDLAYVAFTSGSTGQPKGILGRHGPLTHFLPWLEGALGFRPDDRHTLVSALSHDPLQRDVFIPLWYGATIVAPDPERLGSPGYLARWAAEKDVTVINLAPAMLHLFCQAGTEKPDLKALRRAILVGDVLTRDDVRKLYELAPEVVCFNFYGATETQRSVSYHAVDRDDVLAKDDAKRPKKAVLPVGRGFEDVQLLVLAPGGGLAGVGELGEVWFRGPHLARGYLDDALTRERFVENPFTGDPGDRLYWTGDLGRYLPDGTVELAGRADHQVKLRGFRIELGEIEAVLARHPGVAECAVKLHDDGHGRRLAAYVVVRTFADAPGLRTWATERLPDYMVPSAFVFLDALPLSHTGKVDRRALPEPPAPSSESEYVAPKSPEEKALAGIWQKLLQVERVGTEDNFFELGGHSLLGTQVLAQVREELGVELPLRLLFERPTVAELALETTRRHTESYDAQEMHSLLADIENLSEEEIERLLAED